MFDDGRVVNIVATPFQEICGIRYFGITVIDVVNIKSRRSNNGIFGRYGCSWLWTIQLFFTGNNSNEQ